MFEVIAHVIAAERQHGHRVASNLAHFSELGGGAFRSHRGPDENAVFPIECLIDQWRQPGAAAAEHHGRNRYAVVVFGAERMGGALGQRRSESAIGMRPQNGVALLVLHARLPGAPLPVPALGGWLALAAFPPYGAVFGQHHVREDRPTVDGFHHVRIGFHVRPRRDPEETLFRVNGPKASIGVDPHPGDVVADGPNAVAFDLQALGRNEHGEIRFSTSAGKSRGNILDSAFRALHAHDQHVFGQPAFPVTQIAGNAQRETFLAQQDVSAIARADAPDGIILGKMQDQPAFDVQLGLAVQALGELAAGAQLPKHRGADVRHDPHVQHDVDAIGKLDADLAEG